MAENIEKKVCSVKDSGVAVRVVEGEKKAYYCYKCAGNDYKCPQYNKA